MEIVFCLIPEDRSFKPAVSDVAELLRFLLENDYIDNEAYTYGGQSFAASYFSRFWKGEQFEARTQISLAAIVLGANRSDYFNISGREYDYGPGAGYVFGVEFARRGRNVFSASTAGFWIHSVNGTRNSPPARRRNGALVPRGNRTARCRGKIALFRRARPS